MRKNNFLIISLGTGFVAVALLLLGFALQPLPARAEPMLEPTHTAMPPPQPCNGGCWTVNHGAQWMWWHGPGNGDEDIFLVEPYLTYLRDGYTATVTTTVPGSLNITVGTVNGQPVTATTELELEAGTYEITSPGPSGGFRWTPATCFGWRGPCTIELTKQAAPGLVEVGEQLTYTLRMTNTGVTTLTAILTDTLPVTGANFSFVWPQVSQGFVSVRSNGNQVQFFWGAGELKLGASAAMTLICQFKQVSVVTNTAEVVGEPGGSAMAEAVVEILAGPPPPPPEMGMEVAVGASPDPVQVGESLTYTYRITNTGDVTLTATLTEVFPAQVTVGPQPTVDGELILPPGFIWVQEILAHVDLGGLLVHRLEVATLEGPSAEVVNITTAEPRPEPAFDPCDGRCWLVYPTTRVMEWTGPGDGSEDIFQTETYLQILRMGYLAAWDPTVPGTVTLSIGEVNGQAITETTALTMMPGVHWATSPGESGGFRWEPQNCYGYRWACQTIYLPLVMR